MTEQKDCEHKFVFMDSSKKMESGTYQTHWIKVDRFFCEKCLHYETVKTSEWDRDPPEWW